MFFIFCLGLAKMFHPLEQKKDSELKKACRNVFELARSQSRKAKQSDKPSDDDLNRDDDDD